MAGLRAEPFTLQAAESKAGRGASASGRRTARGPQAVHSPPAGVPLDVGVKITAGRSSGASPLASALCIQVGPILRIVNSRQARRSGEGSPRHLATLLTGPDLDSERPWQRGLPSLLACPAGSSLHSHACPIMFACILVRRSLRCVQCRMSERSHYFSIQMWYAYCTSMLGITTVANHMQPSTKQANTGRC